MKITVLTPPAPLVELEEAKLALGYFGVDDFDTRIEGLIMAAQSELDGPNGWVGITVAEQSLELRINAFCNTIILPYGPVVGVGGVNYLDQDGAELTVDGSVYDVLTGSIVVASGQSWPATLVQDEAVRITYDVGIADDSDPRVAQMKEAILVRVKGYLDGFDSDAMVRSSTKSLRVWGSA